MRLWLMWLQRLAKCRTSQSARNPEELVQGPGHIRRPEHRGAVSFCPKTNRLTAQEELVSA